MKAFQSIVLIVSIVFSSCVYPITKSVPRAQISFKRAAGAMVVAAPILITANMLMSLSRGGSASLVARLALVTLPVYAIATSCTIACFGDLLDGFKKDSAS